jgi:shikimate dehydrogenase
MRQFGLIGYPLSHSFSKKYFDEKFVREEITDTVFENYSLENIGLLKNLLKNKNLNGLAVTIPYKKVVIDFLDEATDAVKQMKACNCITVKKGRLTGYNTDIIGFEQSFSKYLRPQHKRALLLGTGGAAAAVKFVLQKMGIPFQLVSRRKDSEGQIVTYQDLNKEIMDDYQIIINASPVGTFPNTEEAPFIPYQFLSSRHYLFDLVYNPAETEFLRLGKKQGATIQNGYKMLVLQAEENWKIWNS